MASQYVGNVSVMVGAVQWWLAISIIEPEGIVRVHLRLPRVDRALYYVVCVPTWYLPT